MEFDPSRIPRSAVPDGDQVNSTVEPIIANDPRGAILAAWSGLIREANGFLDGLGAQPRKDATETIGALLQRGLLDASLYDAVDILRSVNDQLARGEDIQLAPSFVKGYVVAVGTISAEIRHRASAEQ